MEMIRLFRIRRIFDDTSPGNREAIRHVIEILIKVFPAVDKYEFKRLPEKLLNPLKYRFRTLLFVAEGSRGIIKGFGIFDHAPDLQFCYLDYLSTDPAKKGGGIGGALYERIREEALHLEAVGLFFECLPDDPTLCHDPERLKENKARLRFYERYGARPIKNTHYETPLNRGDDCPPYLVIDDLGKNQKLEREKTRRIIRAILERKYKHKCPESYIRMVLDSMKDDPIKLRDPVYIKKNIPSPAISTRSKSPLAVLVVNDQHDIHHVRERGYVESPVRISSILSEIDKMNLFEHLSPKTYPEKYIKAVHENRFVDFLKKVCTNVEPKKSVYPYVFPIRNSTRPPRELPIQAGYYCIDTFTPLNHNAYIAAKRAVDCCLTAADQLLANYDLAYALVRPPGHHAERRAFGGFCYFNSAAIAAHYLSRYGKAAIIDIDYHHGNGTQDIFYRRADVFTASIHGHPRFAYPYFCGFADEIGEGEGKGFNLNIPLPETVDGKKFHEALSKVLKKVEIFNPRFIVISLGGDTAKGDPTGTWSLSSADFEQNGGMIAQLKRPTLIVQEGGYRTRSLGINIRHFFQGLMSRK